MPASQFLGVGGHARGVHHGFRDAAVDLYGYGSFLLQGVHLGDGLLDVPHQAVRAHELGGDHGCARLPAQDAETGVGDVLHGRQRYRALSKVYGSYLHIACKDRQILLLIYTKPLLSPGYGL